jgi:hypothetical protein
VGTGVRRQFKNSATSSSHYVDRNKVVLKEDLSHFPLNKLDEMVHEAYESQFTTFVNKKAIEN